MLRLFAEHSPAAIAMFDREMRYVVATRRYLSDYRLGDQSVIGRSHYEVFPEIPERWKEIHRRCLAGAVEHADEDPFVRADGTVDWIRWEVRPWTDEAGAIGGIILFSEVITNEKRAEDALRDADERFRATFEQAAVGFAHLTPDGRWLHANRKLCAFLGYSLEELRAKTLRDISHPDHLDGDLAGVQGLLAGKIQNYVTEKRYFRKDGTLVWGALTVTLVRTAAGAPDYFIAVIVDISARKEAERVLRAKSEELESYFDDALDLLCVVDTDGHLLRVNDAWQTTLGYRSEDVVGRHFAELLHPDDIAPATQTLRGLLVQREYPSFAARCRCQDSTYRWIESRARLAGRLIYVVARDVTDRKAAEENAAKLEAQLRTAQKMEAVGQLAGGVAHDFNNLLSVILSYTGFAVDALRAGDPLHDDLKEVLEAGRRAATLTRQLLAFSRRQVLKPEVLDPNAVVAGMEKMLGRLIGEHIELHLKLDPEVERIKADQGQLEQVIMNLVVNARDAISRSGAITLSTANVGSDEAPGAAGGGPFVVLAISDTGCGMDASTRERLFEPFFTTKERGRGTGLGLSTAYGIVKQSGGDIVVDSEPGKGSTFKVYLPRVAAEEAAAPAPKQREERRARGTETVLVVEDEEAVRRLTARLLRSAAYNVLAAAHGGEALLACERHSGELHLVLTDVVMPQMSGPLLAARLRAIKPGLKVLYMSGYADDEIARHGEVEDAARLLAKPFHADELLRKVRAALDGAAAG